eukprot:3501021-Rhodomonas_salina.4
MRWRGARRRGGIPPAARTSPSRPEPARPTHHVRRSRHGEGAGTCLKRGAGRTGFDRDAASELASFPAMLQLPHTREHEQRQRFWL